MTIKDYDTPNKIYSDIREAARKNATINAMNKSLLDLYGNDKLAKALNYLVSEKQVIVYRPEAHFNSTGVNKPAKRIAVNGERNADVNIVSYHILEDQQYQRIVIDGHGIDTFTIATIVEAITSITVEQMKSKRRYRELVEARQLAMFFAKQYTKDSLKTIGYFFGGRDHSTVIHALKTMEDLYSTDKGHKSLMDKLSKIIKRKDDERRKQSIL